MGDNRDKICQWCQKHFKDTSKNLSQRTYSQTPDFKVGNCQYIEIKGWLTEKAKNKLSMFKKEYPFVILEIVSRNEYRKLYSQYSTLIDEWEMIST